MWENELFGGGCGAEVDPAVVIDQEEVAGHAHFQFHEAGWRIDKGVTGRASRRGIVAERGFRTDLNGRPTAILAAGQGLDGLPNRVETWVLGTTPKRASKMQHRRFLSRAAVAAVLAMGPVTGWANEPTKPFTQWEDKEKEQFLLTAKVVKMKDVPTGITGTRRVTLSNGQITHDAHFQTIDVYKREYKTPLRTEMNFRDSYKFNIAAYRLDRLIKLNMVPASVERNIRGKTGSLTWWVDDVQMIERERYNKKIQPPRPVEWMDQMHNVRVFNELVYNTDPNLGNFLITNDWRLRMVDFSRAFRMAPKLRLPQNLGRIDQRVYNGLRSLTREKVESELSSFLRNPEIDGFLTRKDRIVEFFEAAIAEKGELRVICKREGH